MSRGKPKRDELLATFFHQISRQSTWTVIYHQAVALKLGLNPTDLKCRGVLSETGPITAGELAELIGVTTGAVTGIVDRLEKAGLVQRDRDPNDRRRVVIVPLENPSVMQGASQIFGSLGQASTELLAGNFTNEQLEVILDFIQRGTELMKSETAKLRELHATDVAAQAHAAHS
jgi:predicted ArsR family transcriptional regulator